VSRAESVAEKVLRLAKAKNVPEEAILAAIYAGMSEAEILAADSGRLRDLEPRRYGQRKHDHVTTPAPAAPAIKAQPLRMGGR
jgi:hypothetical protein